jgi:hypothetical protein
MKTVLTFLMAIAMVVNINAQTTQQYSVDDIAQFETDLAAGTYDEYILTTSGGIYDLTSFISVTKNTVIKAADGLAEKPMLMRTNNPDYNGAGIINANAENITIEFNGIHLDGTSTGDFAASTIDANATLHLLIDNCFVGNFESNRGNIFINAAGSSVVIRNSTFIHNRRRIVHFAINDLTYGDVTLENTLFSDTWDGNIVFFPSGGTGNNITVNHCTFDNLDTGSAGILNGRDSFTGAIVVKNSVFTNIAAGSPLFSGMVPTFEYCYSGDLDQGTNSSNALTVAPVYEAPLEGNYTITNTEDLIAGTGDVAGVVWYYAPRVLSELIVEDNTHLKVIFSRPMETTSAETVTNYELGGTFGLTGNPISVEAISDVEVLLEVANISAMTPNTDISVTVSNVIDNYGLSVDTQNTATFLLEAIEVFLAEQNVSNADGQSVTLQSSASDGMVYIILDSEPQQTVTDFDAAIAAGKGASGSVTAELTDVVISTFNLYHGTYNGYAVSAEGEISSAGANTITITDAIAPIVSNSAVTVENAPGDFVNIQSNEDNGQVYIINSGYTIATTADLDAAVANNEGSLAEVTEANVDIPVPSGGLTPGTYFAYAVDAAGNISEPGTEPITVNQTNEQLNQYPVEDLARLEADLAAGAYDEYILTTSGGIYDFVSFISLTKNTVIKAADGLEERPILMRTNNPDYNGAGVLKANAEGITLEFHGLHFDGTSTGEYPAGTIDADSTVHIIMNHCYVTNFESNRGNLFINAGGSSVEIRNSIFIHNRRRIIHFAITGLTYGDVTLDNSIFSDTWDGNVVFFPSGGTGNNITVNHCTFNQLTTGSAGIINGRDSFTGEINIKNSVFTNVTPGNPLYSGMVPTVEYCYTGSIDQGPNSSNELTTAPVYAAPEEGNFALTNSEDLIAGTGDVAGVTWYYSPRVFPELFIEDNTHLKLYFSRPVEAASAENAANYELSGTFGLTGNPVSAQLVNEREVLLEVADLSVMPTNTSIIVTASNVIDVYGLMLDNNHNEATFLLAVLEVFADEQNVTNADGQSVVLQSSFATGHVYIVLDGEPQQTVEELDAAVAAGKGAAGVVTDDLTDVILSAFNLEPGTYNSYAVSEDGELSAPGSNAITIVDGIAPVVASESTSVYNGPDHYVDVQSNEASGRVYIIISGYTVTTVADMDAAVASSQGSYADVTSANVNIPVSTTDLIPAIYYAYAVDAAGNISAPGTAPIIIMQDVTSTEEISNSSIKVFSKNNTIYISAPASMNGVSYEVFDISGRKVKSGTISGSTQVETNKSGIFIIKFGLDQFPPIRVLVLG